MRRIFKKHGLKFLKKNGRTIDRYPLSEYLRHFNIDCVVDVGANVGQYGVELRTNGYNGVIESFEPLSEAYDALVSESENDSAWHTNNYALGAKQGQSVINVGKSNATSSFLELESNQPVQVVEYTTTETVEISCIDNIFDDKLSGYSNLFLKIDTQGYEAQVIEGAHNSLKRFKGVQLEVSLDTIYTGETLIENMISLMRNHEFSPYWISNGFRNQSPLKLMQVDIFFFNQESR